MLAFLDLAGDWDPSLAFVVVGAIIPMVLAYAVSRRMCTPLFDKSFFILETAFSIATCYPAPHCLALAGGWSVSAPAPPYPDFYLIAEKIMNVTWLNARLAASPRARTGGSISAFAYVPELR